MLRTRGRGRWIVGAALVVLLTGCGLSAGPAASPSPLDPGTPTAAPSPSASATPGLSVGNATVLDDGSGPELCLGVVLTSLPPQCGGPPIKGWDWPMQGTERADGVRWGSFIVVGRYDGKRFTFDRIVTKKQAAPSLPAEEEPDFGSPCPEPAGGWRASDPARATEQDQEQVFALAEKLPGYGGSWVDDRGDPEIPGRSRHSASPNDVPLR